MGIIVECQDQEIWSPSLQVGNLFFDQIKSLEKVLNTKSGIEFYMADTLEIDESALGEFITRGLKILEETNNGSLFALVASPLQIAIALHAKITGQWPQVSHQLKPFMAKCQTVMEPIQCDAEGKQSDRIAS